MTSVTWEASSEVEEQIPGGHHWINRQDPSLDEYMKSPVQLLAIDKKKSNLDHILTRCNFLESGDLPCVLLELKKKLKTDFYPDT